MISPFWPNTSPGRSRPDGWKVKPFDSAAVEELCRYSWTGNVRELRNVVERLLLLSGPVVDTASVRLALPQMGGNRHPRRSRREAACWPSAPSSSSAR